MNKKVKIIVATHKHSQMPTQEMYVPIHVGAAISEVELGYEKDNSGDNISELNPYFCELTGLYWAWKNLDYDYLGLAHYRRHFAIKNCSYNENLSISDVVLNEEQLGKLLKKYDVLVPKKRKYYIESLYSHYAHTLDGTHLDKTRKIIEEICPSYLEDYDKVMKKRSGYMFNMFIMKKNFVDSYLNWLFPILNKLYEEIDLTNMTNFEARLFGRVSELLFNVWLKHNKVVVKEIPFIYFDKINKYDKVKSFLLAKFFGKKYGQSF